MYVTILILFFNLMNFSFQFVCSTQIKMYQESVLGAFFWYCVLQDRWSFRGLHPLDPQQGSALEPQLLEAMTYDHCISCLRQNNTFIHALTTNLAHHSEFLKKACVSQEKSNARGLCVCYLKVIEGQVSLSTLFGTLYQQFIFRIF